MIIANGRRYVTLDDRMEVNGKRVLRVFANGMLAYPDNERYVNEFIGTLSWGEQPRDIDFHVVGTLANGNQFHVYYSHKIQNEVDGTRVCDLDVDDTSGYGPEHIRIFPNVDEPYYLYVHHYAGNGTIGTSGARLAIAIDGVPRVEFVPPQDVAWSGVNDVWNVCKFYRGQITPRNTYSRVSDASTVSPDIGY